LNTPQLLRENTKNANKGGYKTLLVTWKKIAKHNREEFSTLLV